MGRRTELPIEWASKHGYDPVTAASKREEPTLVALDQWDSEAEAMALSADVNVMFVVKSASARNGKKVRKKYVPLDKSKGKQSPKNVDVHSLLFKFDVDVWTRHSSGAEAADSWTRVSRVHSEGERDDAPMFLAADTKKVEWDLAGVVGEGLYSHLSKALVRLAADWPEELRADSLGDLYGTLGEGAKVEFWRRARLYSPVKIGLSVDAMLNLALEEWSRSRRETGLGSLREEVKGFVNSWVKSAWSGWSRLRQPAWLKAIMGPTAPTGSMDHESTARLVEELLVNFRSRRPQGAQGRRLPTLMVVAPEDVGLAAFTQAAPDPIVFYRAAVIYTEKEYDELRRSKSRWLKSFEGVQVIRFRPKPKTLLRQSAASLDPIPVLEHLFRRERPQWPGDPK